MFFILIYVSRLLLNKKILIDEIYKNLCYFSLL